MKRGGRREAREKIEVRFDRSKKYDYRGGK